MEGGLSLQQYLLSRNMKISKEGDTQGDYSQLQSNCRTKVVIVITCAPDNGRKKIRRKVSEANHKLEILHPNTTKNFEPLFD